MTQEEISALLGLIYYRGLYNLKNISTNILFSDTKGFPVFGAVMSRDRFKFLLPKISFCDRWSRPERWESGRCAAFRDFLEKFDDNCSRYFTPGQFLSFDKMLYPMRHQIAFRQYNLDKPAKYSVIFKSLNSTGLLFLYHIVVFAGKRQGDVN